MSYVMKVAILGKPVCGQVHKKEMNRFHSKAVPNSVSVNQSRLIVTAYIRVDLRTIQLW